jgi:Family of unknown function (DUF6228)
MQATLRSVPSSPTFGVLRFTGAAHRGGGDFKCLATIEANTDTYEVELDMIDPYRDDMLGFFEDMARHKRGWSGVMSWESEFAEMKLDVRNPEGGDVTFDVSMRWPPNYEDDWSGSLVVNADQLPRFAEAMRKLMGADGGSRFVTPGRPRTWKPL